MQAQRRRPRHHRPLHPSPTGLTIQPRTAASALSTHPVTAVALGEAAGQVIEALDGARPELVLVAVTPPHLGTLEDVGAAISALLAPDVVVGAVSPAVIGAGCHVEGIPAVALFAVAGVAAASLSLETGASVPSGRLDGAAAAFLLADPFSCSPAGLGAAPADPPTCGGVVGAARGPGGSRLLLDGSVRTSGAVGALLGAPARALVSQGGDPVEAEADLAAALVRCGPRPTGLLVFPAAERTGDAPLASELLGCPVGGVGVSAPLAPAGMTQGAGATGLVLFP